MINSFKKYVTDNKLFSKSSKILLAVSGGVDSVVMAHIFKECSYNCGIAHCNFQLREEDSESDEKSVEKLARKLNFPFYSISFDTENYAKENGVSIQMAARNLRYEWFEKIRKENKYTHIAIGHNSNDITETFLINLSRGTGIKGLTGIKAKANNIVRPLLFAERTEILKFSQENNFDYREDKSNSSLKYSRNRIRKNIIPELEKINQSFNQSISETIKVLSDAEIILKREIEDKDKKIVKKKNDIIYIDIEKLKTLSPIKYYLFEFLNPYNFNSSSVEDIISVLDKQSGKTFYSNTHTLVKDRNQLIIDKIKTEEINFKLAKTDVKIDEPISIKLSFIKNEDFTPIYDNKNIAFIDADKLEFPLIIRNWKSGDKFMPLGMTNFKKLSNFFIDNKFSIIEKQNSLILENKKDIVWIIGNRLDNRYKLTKDTKNILKIEAN